MTLLACTTPTTATDHIVGLRFTYAPKPPAGVATLASNVFTGSQRAPSFIGSGAGLTNLPAPEADTVGSAQVIDLSLTDRDLAPGSVVASKLASNSVTAPAVAFNYAASTSEGGPATDLACVGCVAAGEVSFPFAALGANTFGGTQTINGGNLAMDASTATAGNIIKGGELFLHLDNTTASFSTAVGYFALGSANGTANIGLGQHAGENLVTGSNNIYIGSPGADGDADTIRVGDVSGTFEHQRAFMAGVRNTTTGHNNAVPVMIDLAGQLGTINSSIRFKEDVHDMGDASRRLLQLRPVTFRYTKAYSDGSRPVQYGLVAEEVAEVFPELEVAGANGQVDTVYYETLNVLLLNELQRQQQRIDALERRLNELLK